MRTMDSEPLLSSVGELSCLGLWFKDPLLEAEFIEMMQKRSMNPAIRLSCVMLVLLICYGFGLEWLDLIFFHDWVARVIGLSYVVAVLHIGGVMFTLCRGLVHPESAVFVTAKVASILCFTSDSFRMSKILESDYYETVTARCQLDAETGACREESVLLLSLVLVGLCAQTLVPLRASRAWVLPIWQSALYALMSQDHLAPLARIDHVILLSMFMALGFLIWLSRRQAEAWERAWWFENRELRLEVKGWEKENQEQDQRLQEVNERLEALRAGAGTFQGAAADGQWWRAGSQERDAFVTHEATPKQRDLRVPIPMVGKQRRVEADEQPIGPSPNATLQRAMAGRQADAARIRRMAERIKEPAYGLKEFYTDCVASFPELNLFFVGQEHDTLSGLSGELEYQRTIGALFCVYWLIRMDSDGKYGFCFGVDEQWQPKFPRLDMLKPEEGRTSDSTKRHEFFLSLDWSPFTELVANSLNDSVERTEAMLCLTAFHDIMKMGYLVPTVMPEHGTYKGYAAGSTILDHDIALSYILEYFPHLLPSYTILPRAMQDVIFFSTGKMQFNHGWLVQAEAPSGPMLSELKKTLVTAKPGDFAFYFFHWLTDLAGAEGNPKGGAEKLVVKFPRSVLSSFMWSIPFLQRLQKHSETEALEMYYAARWERSFRGVDPPTGANAMALMRLTIMAQGGMSVVREAFFKLPVPLQRVLAEELARTGIGDQEHQASSAPGGPALLLYYSPAVLQKCKGVAEMVQGLQLLATVCRGARELWPVRDKARGETSVINLAQIKANPMHDIVEGTIGEGKSVWALVQKNAKEGVVELVKSTYLNELNSTGTKYSVLDFVFVDDVGSRKSRMSQNVSNRSSKRTSHAVRRE